MFRDSRIKCEQMGVNYLGDIIEQAASWKIDYLEKEKKDNGDIEVTLTYGWPTARLVVKEDAVEFHFSYQPFEYRELITDRELINKIKQAI